MVDFTGGFPEVNKNKSDEKCIWLLSGLIQDILGIEYFRGDLFLKLRNIFFDSFGDYVRETNSMVCAGTQKDPPDQLVGGHAYTVLGVTSESESRFPKLIKLRNPWGKQRYNGPWSHTWLEKRGMIEEAELLYSHSTDEFWMPFTRFTKVCFTKSI